MVVMVMPAAQAGAAQRFVSFLRLVVEHPWDPGFAPTSCMPYVPV